MKTVLIWSLGFLATGLLAALTWQYSVASHLRRQSQAEAAAADERTNSLRGRIGDLTRQVQDLESALADSNRRFAELQLFVGSRRDHNDASGSVQNDGESNRDRVSASDPVVVRSRAGIIRDQIERRYAPLLDRLSLSAEQREKVIARLVDKREAAADVTMAAMDRGENGLLSDPNRFAALVAANKASAEADIKSILGNNGYAQYQEWDMSAGASGTVLRLQNALSQTEPLSDAQVGKLQEILDTNHTGHITAKVLTSVDAQKLLTPVQSAAMRDLFQQQQAAQQSRRVPAPSGNP